MMLKNQAQQILYHVTSYNHHYSVHIYSGPQWGICLTNFQFTYCYIKQTSSLLFLQLL